MRENPRSVGQQLSPFPLSSYYYTTPPTQGYENLRDVIEQPLADAKILGSDRVPLPRYVVTEQGGT